MGLLHDKMLADMRLRNLAENTQARYLQQARDFAAYFRRSPMEMGEPEIREFLLHLSQDKQVRAMYCMFRDGVEYRESGAHYFEERDRSRVTYRLVRSLQSLGYRIYLEEAAAGEFLCRPSGDSMPPKTELAVTSRSSAISRRQ